MHVKFDYSKILPFIKEYIMLVLHDCALKRWSLIKQLMKCHKKLELSTFWDMNHTFLVLDRTYGIKKFGPI